MAGRALFRAATLLRHCFHARLQSTFTRGLAGLTIQAERFILALTRFRHLQVSALWVWNGVNGTTYDLDFFFGILAPDFLASLNAIATACLRLFTFLRPPDLSVPSLYSCITFLVFVRPFVADEDRFFEEVFLAIYPQQLDCDASKLFPDPCHEIVLPAI